MNERRICERRGIDRREISNRDPDWILAMAQLEKEDDRGEAEAQEGAGQESRQEADTAEPVPGRRVLTWREVRLSPDPVGQPDYYELVVVSSRNGWEFRVSVTLEPRPAYCDRGRWIGKAFGPLELNSADAFPMYYMDLERAKAELHDWLIWRLQCLNK